MTEGIATSHSIEKKKIKKRMETCPVICVYTHI